MVRFLADKGPRVLKNGYNIIPILPGDKAPSIKGWENITTTEAQLNEWKSNGRANHGLGILTKLTPAGDLDIQNRPMLKRVIDNVVLKIGFAPIRIGAAPKCLLLFRLKGEPFRKISSKIYTDPQGRKAQVEFLGDGQQFVAFHIHPDTHKPYVWLGDDSPEKTRVEDLPEITAEQAREHFVEAFERFAEEEGWPRRPSPGALAAPTERPGFMDPDDIGDNRNEPCGLTEDEIRDNLMLIPNDDAFDAREDWLKIGFAVHHETGGSEFGKECWEDWSEQHSSHNQSLFDKAWNSFGKRDDSRYNGITFRFILKLAKEYRPQVIADRLANAKTVKEWQAVAKEISKLEKITSFEREEHAQAVKEAGKRITGHTISIKIARDMVKPIPAELSDFPLNEDGVALAFAARYKDELRFCATTSRWHQWSGYHWKVEKTKLAFDWARTICRDLRADDPAYEALSKASAAEAVEKFARADRAFAVEQTIWDTDPWLLGTPDGTVDLRTGEVRPARQDDYITRITKVGPGLGAGCPRWLKFLDEATNHNTEFIRYLRMMSGYCLTGDAREQNLLFIHGPGGNGKGVFIHTLEYIFNDYATTSSMDTFADNGGFSRHPADIAALEGYRLIITSEVAEGQTWDETRIKALTGGDRISARFMRQDFFQFTPTFKLMVIGNNAPILRTVDDAIERRLHMAPFKFKPPVKNLQLESELKTEASEILSWMIEGCLDWQRHGLIVPEIVRETTGEYFSEQDTIGQWLDGYTEKGNFNTATTDLKASYDLISGSDGGRLRRNSMAFSDALARRGYKRIRNVTDSNGVRGRGFNGLRLREDWSDDL